MESGAITSYIDVAQVTLYVFWVFLAGLIFYLHREDKREGYPLESDRSGHVRVVGWPDLPPPKTFKLAHGGVYRAPHNIVDTREINAKPVGNWPGAPLQPLGDPMRDGVGPAAWANRQDAPELTIDGHPNIVPMRVAGDFWIAAGDADPRGMTVYGADKAAAGTVRDVWVDRAEPQIRYLEVEAGGRTVLLPIHFARINSRRRTINVHAILASQFDGVPGIASPDQVTKLEEDKITAYYGGGKLYAEPKRLGPLL
jgi:photosynthetic reaction center H subunit